MIYYKYKWNYHTVQHEWCHVINSNSASQAAKENWFLTHNKTYGNLAYVYKLFAIYFAIAYFIIASTVAAAIYMDFALIPFLLSSILSLLIVGVIAIFYSYLVKNTRNLNDIYLIHKESKIHSKLLLLWCISCSTMNIAFIIFQDVYIWLIGGTVMNFPLFAMVYISTYYLKTQQRNLAATPSRQRSRSNDMTTDDIVTDDKLIHEFMLHLSKEYSMEVLLAYIEFNQFQRYIAEQMNRNEIPTDIDFIKFPANIPQSEIIEGKKDEIVMIIDTDGDEDRFISRAKIKAHKLYVKYIKSGSEFEINISSSERNNLSNLLNNLAVLLACNVNLRDLIFLFDECKEQMKLLLSFSLSRFKDMNDKD